MKKMKKKILTALVSMTLLVSGISAVYAEGPGGTPPDGAPGGTRPDGVPGGMPGGSSSAVSEWEAVYEVKEDSTEENGVYDSTGTNENAIHVSEGTLTLTDPTITRSSDSAGGDEASFYGVGAAVLTTGGTTVISGGSITTEGNGAAGAFSYSDTAQSSEAPDYRTVEATASGGRTEKGKFKTLGEELKKLIQKGLDNSFVVRKDGKTILTLPVLIFVAVLLLAFWVTVPLLIVGMIFHFRYGFEGIDLGSESINQTMDKAADYVDDLVEKYKEDHKKD